MTIRFVLDEQLRGGALWHALQQHYATAMNPLDVVRVGDPPDLPRGTQDPDILLWAEREGRIVLTLDKKTMPGHLSQHLLAGLHSPGILVIRSGSTVLEIIEFLEAVLLASDPVAWQDQLWHIP